MTKSGLYIVTLNNLNPISVNANDPRIAAKCITVNYSNCKFGKAKNLATRARNYQKVFGPENVNFFPIAILDDIETAERTILAQLTEWRIRGKSGRMNEWLADISPHEVNRIVIATLTNSGFDFHHIKQVL